jgi:hypothetical protein
MLCFLVFCFYENFIFVPEKQNFSSSQVLSSEPGLKFKPEPKKICEPELEKTLSLNLEPAEH